MKTLTQAAEVLGISRQRVHALIKEGKLPATKNAWGLWAIKESDIKERLRLRQEATQGERPNF